MNTLMEFGLILVSGVFGGQLAHLTRILPRITGYIAVGLLLGPHVSGILNEPSVEQAKIFTELATSFILFQLGLRLDVSYICQQKKILWVSACEGGLTFTLLFGVLVLLGVSPLQAAIAAAIGVSSSPAVTLLIADEYNAKGPIIKNALTLTALNNILAFCLYIMVLPFLHKVILPDAATVLDIIWPPLYRIMGSLALALIVTFVLIYLGRFVGKKKSVQISLLAGSLVLSVAIAKYLNVSMLFTMLILGLFLNVFDRRKDLMEIEFSHVGETFFVLLFVIAGMHLHFKLLMEVGLLALVFVGVRLLAKMLPIFCLSSIQNFTKKQSIALSLTLMPMASMAVGLINTTLSLSGDLAASIAAMLFASIAILETIGPIVTVCALRMTGEITSQPK